MCEDAFNSGGPYYLMTTSQWPTLMYTNEEEFIQGSNLLPMVLFETDVKCLDETVMNNHMHGVLEGTQIDIVSARLRRGILRLQKQWDHIVPNDWDIQFPGISWKDLSIREKRSICRSHKTDMPAQYRVKDGLILRSSYVAYHRTESFFHSAHQYFAMLGRHGEADLEVARQIGELVLLPNEEVVKIIRSWYDVPLRRLTQQQRLDAAKRMKYELSSNNKQIAQILSLPISFVNDMYPVPR